MWWLALAFLFGMAFLGSFLKKREVVIFTFFLLTFLFLFPGERAVALQNKTKLWTVSDVFSFTWVLLPGMPWTVSFGATSLQLKFLALSTLFSAFCLLFVKTLSPFWIVFMLFASTGCLLSRDFLSLLFFWSLLPLPILAFLLSSFKERRVDALELFLYTQGASSLSLLFSFFLFPVSLFLASFFFLFSLALRLGFFPFHSFWLPTVRLLPKGGILLLPLFLGTSLLFSLSTLFWQPVSGTLLFWWILASCLYLFFAAIPHRRVRDHLTYGMVASGLFLFALASLPVSGEILQWFYLSWLLGGLLLIASLMFLEQKGQELFGEFSYFSFPLCGVACLLGFYLFLGGPFTPGWIGYGKLFSLSVSKKGEMLLLLGVYLFFWLHTSRLIPFGKGS